MTQLCIDFGGTNVKMGLVRDGSLLQSMEFAAAGTENDLVTVRRAAGHLLTADAESRPEGASGLTAVGIALPGVVDQRSGQMVRAHGKYAFLGRTDMRAWASDQFGVPAVIENDARAALVGEIASGCAQGVTDAVMVTLGTGIGTAALMGGQLLRGAHDHAGILGGHVTVDLGAPICACGNVGCAESLASSWALEQQLRAHADFKRSTLAPVLNGTGAVSLKTLIAAAGEQDLAAREVFDRFLRVWGAAIVSLCHAYDPEVIVLAGGVMKSRDAVLPPLEEYVREHLWSSSHRPRFATPQRPELSVLLGLSAVAIQSAVVIQPAVAIQRSSHGIR